MLLLGGTREISRGGNSAEISKLVKFHNFTAVAFPLLFALQILTISFAYECHSFHILDVGFAESLPCLPGGNKNG